MSSVDEEEKALDLVFFFQVYNFFQVIFMDILSNVLSKDILDSGPDYLASGAQVVLASLTMLVSIMNENILKIPDMATKFYRLIVYMVEFSTFVLEQMSTELLGSIFHCLKVCYSILALISNFSLQCRVHLVEMSAL